MFKFLSHFFGPKKETTKLEVETSRQYSPPKQETTDKKRLI